MQIWFKRVHKPTSRDFERVDRGDRASACYQHRALKWVMSERMTNQSLRDRFGLPESKSAIVSQVIAVAMEASLIKPDERVGTSRQFARYLTILGLSLLKKLPWQGRDRLTKYLTNHSLRF